MASSGTAWVPISERNTRPDALMRLFLFHHAGGNTSAYSKWPELFDASIEVLAVQLPGRATRQKERPYTEVDALVRDLTEALSAAGLLSKPYALFGHSMGGLVAFELARHIARRSDLRAPNHLFVSGKRPPHIGSLLTINAATATDDEMTQFLARLGGTPKEVLESKDMMAFILPAIRADFILSQNTPPPPEGELLGVRTSLFAGKEDAGGEAPREAEEWRRYFEHDISIRIFDGGHFFTATSRKEVVEAVAADLARYLQAIRMGVY